MLYELNRKDIATLRLIKMLGTSWLIRVNGGVFLKRNGPFHVGTREKPYAERLLFR
jgi:hypothetical protein